MVGFKYLVANYIYSTRTPYGIDKKQIINFMETIENVSYEKGVEHTLDTILKDLVKNGNNTQKEKIYQWKIKTL